MYDFNWHQMHGDLTLSSAKAVVPALCSIFNPDSVLDIGCGDGRWLSCFSECGVRSLAGIDGPWTATEKLVIDPNNFSVRDVSQPIDFGRRFSLAMSLEVAEHVSPLSSEIFVDNMVRHSDVILFGAAIPFQGGFRHINERWQSEWSSAFAAKDFQTFDLFRGTLWNRTDVAVWYKQNMLVYVNRKRPDLISMAANFCKANAIAELPLDIVHPERYVSVASYSQIAFKGLLEKLPKAVANKVLDLALRRT